MSLRPAVRIIFAPIALRNRSGKARGGHTPLDPIVHGETVRGFRTIHLDPRLSEVGKTLLHELTHVRHPDWSEEQVTAYEEIRWSRMGWREKAHLYQLLGRARLEGDPE